MIHHIYTQKDDPEKVERMKSKIRAENLEKRRKLPWTPDFHIETPVYKMQLLSFYAMDT